MGDREPTSSRYRFGVYEISVRRGELRKEGLKIKLQEKPFQVLALLVERAGQTVTREQFRNRLWPADTNVDFDSNLNTALTKVRQALEESAENPRFVETVPRLGYRFLAPVECLDDGEDLSAPRPVAGDAGTLPHTSAPEKAREKAFIVVPLREWPRLAALVALFLVAGALAGFFLNRSSASRLAPPPAGKAVLAVLPFTSVGSDAKDEFLSDELTEELITQISALNPAKLEVIARGSAMRYKGSHETVGQIGRELGADYVLEGSVSRSYGRVLVAAELVQARTQARLWAHTYESAAEDILQMQSDVAGNVADALSVTLLPRTQPAAGRLHRGINEEAYETYLEGRLYWNKRSRESLLRAEKLFTQAVEKDPQFELGYAGLAETYLTLTYWKILSPGEGLPRAREAAEKALGLNDSLGSAHAVLATVSWYGGDLPRAESEFRRAVSLDPANATARQWYAEYLSSLGRHAEAMAQIQDAQQIDPLSMSVKAASVELLYFARRYSQAIEAGRKVVQSDQSFPAVYLFLSRSYLAAGKYHEAEEAELKFRELNGEPEAKRAALRSAFQSGGIGAAWRWKLEDMKQRESREYVSPVDEARQQARLGQRQAALASLEKSYEIGDGSLVWIKVDPALDSLRGEPRFKDLLGKLHLDS